MVSVPRYVVLGLIYIYQMGISPYLPKSCRFTPTCSEYARIAVIRYGIIRGSIMALRRILRCHPFGKSGYDPVK